MHVALQRIPPHHRATLAAGTRSAGDLHIPALLAFIFPLVILRDPAQYPVQLWLATLQGEFNTDYGMLMTGAALAALPLIVAFLAFQRYSSRGSASVG